MNRFKELSATACWGLCMIILAAGTARASDTDIFTGGTMAVPPNILIILDTSGSMAVDALAGPLDYEPATTYPKKGYDSTVVYYNTAGSGGTNWQPLDGGIYCKLQIGKTCLKTAHKTLTVSNITCESARTTLSTDGQWEGNLIYATANDVLLYTYDCPGPSTTDKFKSYELATGNFLNYFAMTSSPVYLPKIDVAKIAIKRLLNTVDMNAVRIGLMRFHGAGTNGYVDSDEQNRGGYLVAKVGSTKAQIENALKDIKVWCDFWMCGNDDYILNPYNGLLPLTSGSTPLAETLAEAGLYFAGKHSWANTSGQGEPGYPGKNNDFGSNGYYTSPIEWRCQKNYVIILTDGMPEDDYGNGNGDNIFGRSDYINGKSIGRFYPSGNRDIDRDGDGLWSCPLICGCSKGDCQHWVDDTAKFLYDADLIDAGVQKDAAGVSYNDPGFSPQRIMTYTIGFGTECDRDFLERVTDSNHGHGMSFIAENGSAIQRALTGIVGTILAGNSNFVTPVVPVSRLNNVYSGNSLYISLFRSESGAVWEGNLKKFGYGDAGDILSKDLSAADFSGTDLPTSCWGNSSHDGIIVTKGGVGAQLLAQSTRNFYFYNKKAATTSADLTNSVNLFSVNNPTLTDATANVLDLENSATADDRTDLIHFLRGDGIYKPGTGSSKREWVLGDILHSRPAVLRDSTKNVIFVGSNDGFLHCFVDEEGSNQATLADDTVFEAWCFTPYELLPSMHLMKDSTDHQYFVDGSPVLYSSDKSSVNCDKYLTFGLRRGGPGYYTLKVGEVRDSAYMSGGYLSPRYAWEIGQGILQTGGPLLGLSWGDPHVCRLKTGSNAETTALIIPGGYDEENQDLINPAAGDTKGMAVFAVKASDGQLLNAPKFTGTNLASMANCIVDLVTFDLDGDGYTDSIYAGDMGGKLFAMKQRADCSWDGRLLFQGGNGTNATSRLKFFYAPDVAVQGFSIDSLSRLNDYLYIGTGDREHPNDKTTQNRFYAVKNKDDGKALAETDLKDVTNYSVYNIPDDLRALMGNDSCGWFIRLGVEGGALIRPGEKVVSSPLVFDKVVYFTTYVPSSSTTTTDRCYVSAPGEGFLYGVNYLTGEAVRELQFNTTEAQANGTAALTEVNRRISLGNGMPTPPRFTVTSADGPVLVIGTKTVKIPFGSNGKEHYWMQK